MIGRTISHYRIVEKLGSGGMGVVYRARDEQLERDVAIKFLPPGLLVDDAARKRFHKEALTLARLHHANIGTIYEFNSEKGSDFLVMECIPGTTLAERLALGPLPGKEVLGIAAQVAAALEEAHEQGVVHCDLKPSNVLLTLKGQVKVLDFGVARMAQQAADETSSTTSTVDEPAAMPGTLPYMAPEQLLGETPDPRTDIHAFGALLYEMITGRRAFPELLIPRVIESILRRAPLALSALVANVPPELERIILKCLEKSRDNRYQSAKELSVDLRRLAAPSPAMETTVRPTAWRRRRPIALFVALILLAALLAALLVPRIERWRRQILGLAAGPPIHSLAVLPVRNLSENPAQQYFADGITGELIAELGEIHALRVVGTDSVMLLNERRQPLDWTARQLHADAVLIAAVERFGNQARLTVSLVRPANKRPIWSRSYEFELQEIPEIGHAIATAVARQAHVELTPEERAHMAVSPKVDPAAEDAYLRGRSFFLEGTEGGLARARAAFERAIAADPNYAPAYAGLAAASVFCACPDRPHGAVMAQAKQAALRALELDEGQAQAHAALGFVEMTYEYDWPAAQRELKRAVALRPNSARAHLLYAAYLVQSGRFQEGIGEARIAVDLDPLSVQAHTSLGLALYYARHVDAAIEQFEKTLRMDPGHGAAHCALGMAYAQAGRYEEAAAQFQKAIALGHQATLSTARLAHVYALMGGATEARMTADNIASFKGPNKPPAYALALIHTALGDKTSAIHWLERAYKAREPEISCLKVDPSLDPLRSDPRFETLLNRVGIP